MTESDPEHSTDRANTWAGFFPCLVAQENVRIAHAGVVSLVARGDVSVRQGAGSFIGAGNDVEVSEGGSFIMAAGNMISMDKGGAALIAARTVDVKKSYVGLAVGKDIRFDADSRPMLGPVASVLGGLALGFVLGLLGRRAS